MKEKSVDEVYVYVRPAPEWQANPAVPINLFIFILFYFWCHTLLVTDYSSHSPLAIPTDDDLHPHFHPHHSFKNPSFHILSRLQCPYSACLSQ